MTVRRVNRSELSALGYLYIYGGNLAAAVVASVSLVALPAALITGEMSIRDSWLIYWMVFLLGSLLILGLSLRVWWRQRRPARSSTRKRKWNSRMVPHVIVLGCVIGAVCLALIYGRYLSLQENRKQVYCSDFSRSAYRVRATREACEAQIGHCWREAARNPAPLAATSYLPSDPFRRAVILCLQSRVDREGR